MATTTFDLDISEISFETKGPFESLLERIDCREARVGVIGLGYVGLPLAVSFARAGFSVTGFDLDRDRIERANRGSSYIVSVKQGASTQRDRGELGCTHAA